MAKWTKHPTRENGALVLHAYVPDYAATDIAYDIPCAVCGARSEGDCYDDRMGKWPRDSITIRAAYAFGDWDRERIPWAW